VSNEQKAISYYKSALLKVAPPFVPSRVNVLRNVFGDHPFPGAGVVAGQYNCQCNKWGAVGVLDRDGKLLGLRPDEFEIVEWVDNVA